MPYKHTGILFTISSNLAGFLILITLITGLTVTGFSQSKFPGTISGKVLDSKTFFPVEYANIVVFDTLAKNMVTGAVTDSNGYFRITNVPYGVYYIEYSFIGYADQKTRVFSIDRKKPKAELGELSLAPTALTMDEVTIQGERTTMITKIDRKIFNVQNDILSQTGTVTDILQTIPSISVDMDGNVSLRGSENVTILINGRPSLMTGAANLEQMPASLIERIEVITNPSAKYRPDGTAGIINIILKKERKAGFNGVLGANIGNHGRFNTNLQLNLNTGKVNLFGSYGYRHDYRFRKSSLFSQTIDTTEHDTVNFWQNSEGSMMMNSHLVNLGVDWNITTKNAGGISGTYNYREVKRTEVAGNIYQDSTQYPTEEFTRSLDGNETENSYGLKAYYEHTFSSKTEHFFKADVDFQSEYEKEDDFWTNVYSFPAYPDENDYSDGNNLQRELIVAAEYNRPLWKDASLDAGYEGNMQITRQDQDVFRWDPDDGIWVPDPESANHFYSRQTVHAFYTTVSFTWKKLSVMGGLRAEETLLDLEFRTLDTVTKSDYFALYPTLHMGLSSGDNEWQLNYSKRVNRPDGDDMNPVPEYRDPRNIFVGNPDLKPENIHSFELGYSFHPRNLTLVPAIFYRVKVNGFTVVTRSLNDTVLEATIENLATDQSAGIDLSGNWQIGKIANLNFSASGFYNQIDASNIGYSSNKSAYSWNAKLNASFNITRTTILQGNGQYRSSVLTPQGMRCPTWVVNLGFRQDFWKKRISLIMTVSDLFNSQVWKTSIDTPILVQESTRRRDARVIYGGIVFNIGSQGKKSKETKFEYDNNGGEN